MLIGKVAKLTGASEKAIRHYEALGLLGPVRRTGKYRAYSDDNVLAVRLIRQAQAVGFKLDEIRRLGGARSRGDWAGLIAMIERKRGHVAAEIERLRSLDAALAALVGEVRECEAEETPVRPECAPT